MTYMPAHRWVAEQTLGRKLLPGEVVHHINGNSDDNRPENLTVLASASAHARVHAEMRHGSSVLDSGGRLRRARDRMGYSREKLARALDPPLSMKTIERWENGTSRVPRSRVAQIAVLCGVDLADLVGHVA